MMTISGPEASRLLVQLAVAAARTTILAAVAGLLLAAFRVNATRLRLFTWTAVLYAGLGMPLLGGLLPSIRIPMPVRTPATPTRVANNAYPTTVTPSRPFGLQDVGSARIITVASSAQPSVRANSWKGTTIASLPLTTAAFAGYVLVAFFLLTRLIIGVVLARRLVRNSIPVHDLRLTARIHDPKTGRVPGIRESQSVSVPLTIGVFNPTVLLPTTWRQWDNEKLTGVLAHEMSHVERHDCLSQYAARLYRAVFWFSPLAWWLNRQIIELAEQASDEEALSRGADQNTYARMLLGFLETVHAAPGRIRWQGVSMASSGRAEKRLEKVLAWRGDKKMATRKSALIAGILLAVPVSYLVAAGRPVSASPVAHAVTVAQDQAPAAPAQQPPQPAPVEASPMSPSQPQAPGGTAGDVAPAAPANPVSPAPPTSSDVAVDEDASKYQADSENHHRGFWYRYGYDDEQRFVIVSGKSTSFTMSGSGEDARHAEKLRQRIPGDFIWFERDEKSYIIRDQATVERARQLWAPQEELGKKQEALGKQQEALGKQQEELGKRMQAVRVKLPDMTAEFDKLKAELTQLGPNATVEQVGRIQSEIGRLQSEIGRIQSEAGDAQGKVGEEMGALGEKQGELGRQQGELGRQQGELAEKANREMRQLLDDAIKNGIAQPESSQSGGASL